MGRRILWMAAVVAAALTAYASLRRPADGRLTDLGVYTGAVDGLRHGQSLYDFMSHLQAPFTYPPFAGLLFLPLAGVPTLPLQIAWTVATLAAVSLLAVPVTRRLSAARRPWLTPAVVLILMLSAPVVSNIRFGQVSLFLAVLIAVDVLVLRQHPAHGFLIGVAAAVKLTPLIFIPMLWLAGRRRGAVVATATFAACGLVAILFLPGDSWRFWTTEITRVSRLGNISHPGNQSLNGALLRFGLADHQRAVLTLLMGGLVAALALWLAAHVARRGDWLCALVVTGAAGVVLAPVSWTHHQIWLVLAAAVPLRAVLERRIAGLPALGLIVVLAVMLLPLPALGGPIFGNIRLLLAIATALLLAPVVLGLPARRAVASGQARSSR